MKAIPWRSVENYQNKRPYLIAVIGHSGFFYGQVTFGLSFIQLLSISEKRQVMKSNVWLTLSWTDYQLQWRPSHYNGIKAVRIPVDKIWQPDVVRQESFRNLLFRILMKYEDWNQNQLTRFSWTKGFDEQCGRGARRYIQAKSCCYFRWNGSLDATGR